MSGGDGNDAGATGETPQCSRSREGEKPRSGTRGTRRATLENRGYGLRFMAMKTTIDIADYLLRRAKEVAKNEDLTLKQIVEEGLEMAMRAREKRDAYKAKPVVFRGKGLSPGFRQAG